MKPHKPHRPNAGSNRANFQQKFGRPIESFDSYRRATDHLARSTQSSMKRTLSHYFLYLGEDPDAVIANRQRDLQSLDATENERYERQTTAYLRELEANGVLARVRRGRIQSFFSNNAVKYALNLRHLKLSKARRTVKYSPTREDVKALFSKADCSRDRLIIAIMFQHGPAPVDVADLKVGDYPVEPWTYFERSRSKTGETWRGVSSPDVCQLIAEYMNIRGKPEKGTPLIVGRQGPLDAADISAIVAKLRDAAGYGDVSGFKPTSLRDGFEDAMVDANLNHKVKENFMGHATDIEHEYGGFRRMTERLTEAYRMLYPHIALLSNPQGNDALAFSPEELAMLKEMLLEYQKRGKGGSISL